MSIRIVPKTIADVQQPCTLSLYIMTNTATFAEALRQKMIERDNISAAELSRQSGVSKQNISRIINNVPHSETNAPPKVTTVTVRKLARALGWNINEALTLAGYAAPNTEPPNTLREFTETHFPGADSLTDSDFVELRAVLETLIKTKLKNKE